MIFLGATNFYELIFGVLFEQLVASDNGRLVRAGVQGICTK